MPNTPAKSRSLPSTPVKSPLGRDVTNLVDVLSPQRVQAERDSARLARVAKQLLYDEAKDESQLSLSAKAFLEGCLPSVPDFLLSYSRWHVGLFFLNGYVCGFVARSPLKKQTVFLPLLHLNLTNVSTYLQKMSYRARRTAALRLGLSVSSPFACLTTTWRAKPISTTQEHMLHVTMQLKI
jgi:hypothetical protein